MTNKSNFDFHDRSNNKHLDAANVDNRNSQ